MGDFTGGIHKQFFPLHGKPLLSYTIQKFENSEYVDEVIVVAASEVIPYIKDEIVVPFQFTKVSKVLPGGRERQDSVYEGLKGIEQADMVLVHDGVRPFVRTEKIDVLIEICDATGAAILAVRPKDTVKMQDNGMTVKTTLDRNLLWNVQTPQAFDYKILYEAFENAYAAGFSGTDESTLVEKIGYKVTLVEGDYDNVKITTPNDLALAEFILDNAHQKF